MREFILENDDYALFDKFQVTSVTQEYIDCKIVAAPEKYDYKPNAYAFQKHSPYLYIFNHFMKEIKEKGVMDRIWKKYETGSQNCPDYSGKPLGISTCIGAFIVLIFGMILCGCLFVLEKLSKRCLGFTNLLDNMMNYVNTAAAGNSANGGEQRPGGLQNGRLSRRERRTMERETSPPNRSRSARGRINSANRADQRRQNTPEDIPPSGRQGEVQDPAQAVPNQGEAPVPAVRAAVPLRQPGQIRNPALAAAENAGQNNRVVARGLAEADSLLRELENLDRRRQREVRRGANPLMIRPISPNRDPSQGPPP